MRDLQSEGFTFTFHWRSGGHFDETAHKKRGLQNFSHRPISSLYLCTAVEADPTRAGLELAPSGDGALPGLDSHDGEHTFPGISARLGIVCVWAGADVQIGNADPHEKRHLYIGQFRNNGGFIWLRIQNPKLTLTDTSKYVFGGIPP